MAIALKQNSRKQKSINAGQVDPETSEKLKDKDKTQDDENKQRI